MLFVCVRVIILISAQLRIGICMYNVLNLIVGLYCGNTAKYLQMS